MHVYNCLDGDLRLLVGHCTVIANSPQTLKLMNLTVHPYQYTGYMELKSHDWLVLPLAETTI